MYKKLLILAINFFVILNVGICHAEKVFEYGFEDWGGSVEATPDYPFTSGYASTMEEHYNCSEVVSSYDGMMPHSGNYMFLMNHSGSVALNPSVDGINSGSWNVENYVGLNASYGGNNNFDIENSVNGECFVSFWTNLSNWQNQSEDHNTKLKLVRFYESNVDDVIFMIIVDYETKDPKIAILAEGSYHYGPIVTSIGDGNWHKFSMYANYHTGQTAIWVDVENESLDNATHSWKDSDGQLTGGPSPSPIKIMGNYSAHNPTGEQWHAIDDIEVWNSLPDESDQTSDLTPPFEMTVTSN